MPLLLLLLAVLLLLLLRLRYTPRWHIIIQTTLHFGACRTAWSFRARHAVPAFTAATLPRARAVDWEHLLLAKLNRPPCAYNSTTGSPEAHTITLYTPDFDCYA